MAGNQFPRALRLKRRRLIRPLFDRSRGDVGFVNVGVVQIRFRVVPRSDVGADVPVQVGFAPGGRTRTKVGRNRVRRVMRDIFRHQQHGLVNLFNQRGLCLTMMVLFRGKEDTATGDLRRDFPAALRRLEERLSDAT
ncbi:MAG: ribonuclease P protein component [Bacteroidetes bacterium]|nr:ribonuclease P protein component [Bacteroidota bacterium]